MTDTSIVTSAPRQEALSTEFLYGDVLWPSVREGRSGVAVAVRLPSYRGLPLSCVVDVEVSIDGGAPIGSEELVLVLGGSSYRVSDLRPLRDVVWFGLDVAELFIPLSRPLADGAHDVSATLHLLTPFATAGRSVNKHDSSKKLPIVNSADLQGDTK